MRTTLGFENYAVTAWFNQIVNKNLTPMVPLEDDYMVFVGIPVFRDDEIVSTLNYMVIHAAEPKRLRIVIANVILDHENQIDYEFIILIEACAATLREDKGPTVEIHNYLISDVPNIYSARRKLKSLYKKEVYQL